jgi:abhydrolase domain-containing protein 17
MGDTVSTLLFQPPPPSKLKKHKIVWLTTARGNKIPGFYISYKREGGIESCRSLSVDEILDSQDLGSIYPWCKFLSKMLQVNLFAYDYSGYGMAMDCGTLLLLLFLLLKA